MRPVYTWTVVAPASRQASASSGVKSPPHAFIGNPRPVRLADRATQANVPSSRRAAERPPRPTDSVAPDRAACSSRSGRRHPPPARSRRARARLRARPRSERRELHEQRQVGRARRSSRPATARWASLSRSRPHETFGQLAFSSIASTCGARSAMRRETRRQGSGRRCSTNRAPCGASRAEVLGGGLGARVRQPHRVHHRARGRATATIRGLGLPARAARVIVPPTT